VYSTKTNAAVKASRKITIEFVLVDGPPLTEEDTKCMTIAAESVRLSARIVDMPCNYMHTDLFLEVGVFFFLFF